MLSKNDSVKEIFSRFSGKYRINRIIDNYGYGEGVAYFLLKSLNELIYKEELQIHYHDYDYQIHANQEYRYIFKNSNITKYFIAPEKSLFYQLKFVDADRVYSNDLKNWNVKRGASTHSLYLIGEHASPPKFCRNNSSNHLSIQATGSHLCSKDQYNATLCIFKS
ncbi:DUF6314 family protein [Rickettsia montanensis]|uniref:DUF6314 domain-containing protein n=1 Tax=Rickettsia montanensis (strain OSU 85-930) TaxID=1105114 RepID=H8KBN4_RICMS|nr:DUF6314 family protein [Rickettsia montanensis]AFC73296.1 hypothetical protein MCI_01790 [Rickettsia montanensis str. OSU 85-930]